jgi:hypothetical protein
MHVAGANHARGDVVDVAGEVASYLAAAGRAELVRGEQPDTPERVDTTERTAPERAGRRRPETTSS